MAKKRCSILSALTSCIFTMVSSAHAAPLSLSKAVHDGLALAPQVKAAEARLENSRWKKIESFSGHLPTIALNGSYLANKKYMVSDFSLPGAPEPIEVPQVAPTTIWSADAQLPIFDGFATTARNESASRFKWSAESNLEWQRFQLERDIALQFYRAIAARELRSVAAQNQRTLEDHLKDVRLFQKAGMSTHYDVLRVEVQTSEAKSEVLNSDDNEQLALVKLAELIGYESGDKDGLPTPAGGLPVLTLAAVQGVETAKVTGRKDLEALDLRIQGLDKSSDAARRHYFPKVSLFAQYQYYNSKNDSPGDRSSYRSAYATGLSMNWILFNGFGSTARARESVSEKQEAEFNLSAQRRKAESDAEFWRRKFSYYINLFQARTSDIAKSEESLRLAKVGQKEGTRTTSDLLDAETDLFRAKAGAIQAQLGSIEALLNLEQATGKNLYKFWE